MIITWDLDPIAFTIPFLNLSVRWYGLLFACGFIIGFYFVRSFFIKQKLNTDLLESLLTYMFVGTVIGARLGHCLFYEPSFYLRQPLEILKIWHGGLASHGGGIGLVIAVALFCYKHHFKFFPLADLLCIPTAFVGGMIRLGNLCNSEIFGKVTNSEYFGFFFLRLGEQTPQLRHPVQLYEACGYFLISIALWFLFKKTYSKFTGLVLGNFLTSIFLLRIGLEFFKPEQANYISNEECFTVGQWLSLPFIITGIILISLSLKKYLKPQVISNYINCK